MGSTRKLLVVQAAALGYEFLGDEKNFAGLSFQAAESVLPALTCTVQASFRTASRPAEHGMVANGRLWRDLRKVMFWEQSAALVAGERIWGDFRRRGGRVGMLFWQQSLGEDVDVLLSPAPIHKHHGGMIQDCYAKPAGLYRRLCRAVGGAFRLRHYWGPMASAKAGDWIAAATAALLRDAEIAPDLCMTYLPTLDYDLQRFGPDHPRAQGARAALRRQLLQLFEAAEGRGYEMLVYGDCAVGSVSRTVFPNRALLEAGLLHTREVRGMLYPDLYASRAFALADHEIAHVYIRDPHDVERVRQALCSLDDVGDILDGARQAEIGLGHPNGGELVLVAGPGAWVAYPWWTAKRQGPDYATHVDIHSKPGYDPCELFFGWPPLSVSQDPAKIRGSHGRLGPGRRIAWATTFPLPHKPADLVALSAGVRQWLDSE